MVEVRLHGSLAQTFGKVWHLDIQTPHEAVRAIEAAKRGFRAAIMQLSEAGMVFRVRSKDHDYAESDIGMQLGTTSRIDIIPVVCGASAGFRFIAGAVLAAIGYFVPGFQPLIYVGASLMFGAVTEWLTPKIKPVADEGNRSLESWTLNGPSNTADQGNPVPVIYGEVLTGAYPISAGISASQVNPGGTLTPSVLIGGNSTPVAIAGNSPTVKTLVVTVSASPYNLEDPFTFVWSYTGFPQAVARRVVQSDATLRLELDYLAQPSLRQITDVGQVSVECTGRETSSTTSVGTPGVATVSNTREISATIEFLTFDPFFGGQNGS